MINSFKDLLVWQKSHKVVLRVYDMSKCFPVEEKFGLTSQIRRSAVSIPANIAEGFKKRTVNDKLKYYNIAQASLEELRYYTILSFDLGYVQDLDLEADLEEVSKMLEAFCSNLKSKSQVNL